MTPALLANRLDSQCNVCRHTTLRRRATSLGGQVFFPALFLSMVSFMLETGFPIAFS